MVLENILYDICVMLNKKILYKAKWSPTLFLLYLQFTLTVSSFHPKSFFFLSLLNIRKKIKSKFYLANSKTEATSVSVSGHTGNPPLFLFLILLHCIPSSSPF